MHKTSRSISLPSNGATAFLIVALHELGPGLFLLQLLYQVAGSVFLALLVLGADYSYFNELRLSLPPRLVKG